MTVKPTKQNLRSIHIDTEDMRSQSTTCIGSWFVLYAVNPGER